MKGCCILLMYKFISNSSGIWWKAGGGKGKTRKVKSWTESSPACSPAEQDWVWSLGTHWYVLSDTMVLKESNQLYCHASTVQITILSSKHLKPMPWSRTLLSEPQSVLSKNEGESRLHRGLLTKRTFHSTQKVVHAHLPCSRFLSWLYVWVIGRVSGAT